MTLEFTGERFVPGTPGSIAYEHMHRYAFARRFAQGKRVLDAACGEGYGAAQLAQVASTVCGVDISPDAIAHATATYGAMPGVRFACASVADLPLPPASIDVVVSFETIEHIPQQDQSRMIAEFARVLTNDGVLVLSSPNRRRYSDARSYRNPFHLHELYRDELRSLLAAHFPCMQWFHQEPMLASALRGENELHEAEAWVADDDRLDPAPVPDGMYYVVVAAKREAALPKNVPALSVFHDRERTELARADAAHAEVVRLDALLADRETSAARQHDHILHLESLVAYRDRVIEERDAQLAGLNAAIAQQREQLAGVMATAQATQARADATEARVQTLMASLDQAEARLRETQEEMRRIDAAIAAQERIIAYRQSLRWWVRLPWFRVHAWWQRLVRS